MTFKLLCLGAAAALVIAPTAFAQTSAPMGARSPTPSAATPIAPAAPTTPMAPAQTVDPSANVGAAANANATVGPAVDPSCTTSTTARKKTGRGAVNGSANCSTSNGSMATPPSATPAPNSMAPTTPR